MKFLVGFVFLQSIAVAVLVQNDDEKPDKQIDFPHCTPSEIELGVTFSFSSRSRSLTSVVESEVDSSCETELPIGESCRDLKMMKQYKKDLNRLISSLVSENPIEVKKEVYGIVELEKQLKITPLMKIEIDNSLFGELVKLHEFAAIQSIYRQYLLVEASYLELLQSYGAPFEDRLTSALGLLGLLVVKELEAEVCHSRGESYFPLWMRRFDVSDILDVAPKLIRALELLSTCDVLEACCWPNCSVPNITKALVVLARLQKGSSPAKAFQNISRHYCGTRQGCFFGACF